MENFIKVLNEKIKNNPIKTIAVGMEFITMTVCNDNKNIKNSLIRGFEFKKIKPLLRKKRRNFEENLEVLTYFCQRYKRLPNNYKKSRCEMRLRAFMTRNPDNPVVMELKKKYGK